MYHHKLPSTHPMRHPTVDGDDDGPRVGQTTGAPDAPMSLLHVHLATHNEAEMTAHQPHEDAAQAPGRRGSIASVDRRHASLVTPLNPEVEPVLQPAIQSEIARDEPGHRLATRWGRELESSGPPTLEPNLAHTSLILTLTLLPGLASGHGGGRLEYIGDSVISVVVPRTTDLHSVSR